MIKTSFQIIQELTPKYKAPKNKLLSLEKNQKLFKVVRGLYETEKSVSPLLLSSAVYGPSYISFETALSYWGLIPEKVVAVTAATFGKNRTKSFDTENFGLFLYRDVPNPAFPYEVYIKSENKRNFLIAGKEKALCDTLYKTEPLLSEKHLREYLFENLRIEESELFSANLLIICELCDLYKSTNLKLFKSFVQKRMLFSTTCLPAGRDSTSVEANA